MNRAIEEMGGGSGGYEHNGGPWRNHVQQTPTPRLKHSPHQIQGLEADEDVNMIAAEAPVLFAKAAKCLLWR